MRKDVVSTFICFGGTPDVGVNVRDGNGHPGHYRIISVGDRAQQGAIHCLAVG